MSILNEERTALVREKVAATLRVQEEAKASPLWEIFEEVDKRTGVTANERALCTAILEVLNTAPNAVISPYVISILLLGLKAINEGPEWCQELIHLVGTYFNIFPPDEGVLNTVKDVLKDLPGFQA